MTNNARLLAHSKAAAAATEAAKSNPNSKPPVIPDPPADVRDQGVFPDYTSPRLGCAT